MHPAGCTQEFSEIHQLRLIINFLLLCTLQVVLTSFLRVHQFLHVHHMEIVPFRLTANFQPDLSLSVFLERFSVCSSDTNCTIGLFQFGVPKPLGTHVDRGSAVDHHQTFMGSWVPLPRCLFMGSWIPIPSCFPFFNFIHSANTLAQLYNIDFVFNRVNVLLSKLGVWIFGPQPRSPSCRGLLVTSNLVRNDPFSAHVAFFVIVRFSTTFAFAVAHAFVFALVAILALSFALALAFCSCLFNPRPLDLFL